jgi:hypothetical protein
MTEEQFCQQYARIECDKVSALCNFDPTVCQPIRNDACRANAASLKGTGHQFNPSNTGDCLNKLTDSFKTLPILPATLQQVDDSCARVFGGTAKATELCSADYDCAGGLVCDKGHCGTLHTVSSGGGCANIGERCPSSEFCTNDTPNQLYLCVKRVEQGAPCSLTHPCADGLRCRDVCVPKLKLQDACTVDEDCQSDYCTPYIPNPSCGVGLTFSPLSASCVVYMTVTDGGAPMRGTNPVTDAGTD